MQHVVGVLVGARAGEILEDVLRRREDGNDLALLGSGSDTFVWNPGDDNDILEGQAGFDTMLFNGANVAENIDISADGASDLLFQNRADGMPPAHREGGTIGEETSLESSVSD